MTITKYLTLCCILLFHQINCQTRSLLSTHLSAAGVPLPNSTSPTKNKKVCEALFAAWAYSMTKPRKVKPEIAKDFRLKKVDYNVLGNQYYISGTQKRSARIDANSPWIACQQVIDDHPPNGEDNARYRYKNIKVFIDPTDPQRAKMRIKYKRHKGWLRNTIGKDYEHVLVFDRKFTAEGYYDYVAGGKHYDYGTSGYYYDDATAANRWWPGIDLFIAYSEAHFALWNEITPTFGMRYTEYLGLDRWFVAPTGTTEIGIDFKNAHLGLYKEIMTDLQREVTDFKKRVGFERKRTDLRLERKYTATDRVSYTFYMEDLDQEDLEEYRKILYKTEYVMQFFRPMFHQKSKPKKKENQTNQKQ